MMQNLLAKWRRVPYTFSLVFWLAGLLLIGERIGAPYYPILHFVASYDYVYYLSRSFIYA